MRDLFPKIIGRAPEFFQRAAECSGNFGQAFGTEEQEADRAQHRPLIQPRAEEKRGAEHDVHTARPPAIGVYFLM